MCGRNDKDKRLEEKIKTQLVECPDLIQRYMRSIWLTKEATTKYVYLSYLKHFYKFLCDNGIDIMAVKPMDIDYYISEAVQGKDGKTNGFQIINARLTAIINFYDFLVENQLITFNPCSNKKKLKTEKKTTVTYMTPDEVNKLKWFIKHGSTRYKKYVDRDLAIVELGCSTGLRVSAIINIDMEDIDFEERSIWVVEKGGIKKQVFFGENTEKALLQWIKTRREIVGNEDIKPLFISKLKKRMSKEAINDMLKSATREAGINKNITPHKMRSTCGMNLYGATGDIKLTQDVLGHANISNTMIYVKATEEQKKAAANILDSLY